MEYTIRPVTEEELPDLLTLYRAYHKELQESGMPYDTNEEALEGVLRTRIRSRLILTAAAVGEDGRLGGFVFCSILRLSNEYQFEGSAVTGYLNDLYVAPPFRRGGLAARLTGYAEDWLTEQGVPTMQLQVLQKNENAHRFWQKVGMRPVGTLYDKKLEKRGT